jgi:hypothetical protein
MTQGLAVNYDTIRSTLADLIYSVTGIQGILEEPELPVDRRPKNPYFSFKITQPGLKSGDDSKQFIGGPTGGVWNSGGCRKMTIDFNCYADTHEQAFNYMATWQTALDLEDVQQTLRAIGVAVWVIGTVADLSKLLNTGYEGRAHLDVSFGIAMNLQSDIGRISTAPVAGQVTTDQGNVVPVNTTVTAP